MNNEKVHLTCFLCGGSFVTNKEALQGTDGAGCGQSVGAQYESERISIGVKMSVASPNRDICAVCASTYALQTAANWKKDAETINRTDGYLKVDHSKDEI